MGVGACGKVWVGWSGVCSMCSYRCVCVMFFLIRLVLIKNQPLRLLLKSPSHPFNVTKPNIFAPKGSKPLLIFPLGWLSDVTGSYDMAFYGSGVIIVLSGLILFMAPWLERYDSRDYGEHGNEDEEGGEGGEGGERRRQKKEGKNKNIRKNKKKDTGLNGVVIVNGSVSEGRPVEVVAERD